MSLSSRVSPGIVAIAAALLAPSAGRAEPAPAPRPKAPAIVLAAPADLAAATAAVEQATGAKGSKLPFDVPLAEGVSFDVAAPLAERLLEGSHAPFKKAGFYLFRYERSYGMAGDKDKLGLLATADQRVVLRRVRTGEGQRGLTNDQVVAWLDGLAKDEPFDLLEIGPDYVWGRFDRVPKDAASVARRCADFAPDLVAGRASTLDLLAAEIRTNRTLYLVW